VVRRLITMPRRNTKPTWFDKLTMSAHPEPVEGRDLRGSSWLRDKPSLEIGAG
jgi:hypothetical protein